MNIQRDIFFTIICVFTLNVYSHDTTHVHPLITSKIAELIERNDSAGSYENIYEELPNEQKNSNVNTSQRLYWGTDFDAGMKPFELTQDWVLENQPAAFHEPLNVINGVVQEDIPDSKVKNHFYHATTGTGLLTTSSILNATINSRVVAMGFFEQAIEYFGMYDESAKKIAFFTFGQSLHHVEDTAAPAHIHNDTENALLAPIRRYDQLKNTHVANSTLRFLNCPCLVLKQTASFSGVDV